MEMKEYELAGIETIARGVCIQNGKVLLCKARGGSSTYLPGGHIEFGETGREALVREMKEEMGVESHAGAFLGAVENKFTQHGKPHQEINLVYCLTVPDGTVAAAKEDWIDFEWRDIADIDNANLLPVEMKRFLTFSFPMRRKERELTREEALEIFSKAEQATVSVITDEGPYGFPISPVTLDGTLYFHSAMEGRKVRALTKDPRVWISAFIDVVHAEDKFTAYYKSAMAWGELRPVTDPAEACKALKALCEKFTPGNMPDFGNALQRSLARTAVYALKLDNVSGKSKRRKTDRPNIAVTITRG